ncbi:MAG: DNA-binding protein [Bacilli bacterium]|jgi:predicted DNA-binding protein YlxM (UPF0122 family)|nr:DNA-binding protein [Bacilli bacterium]
MSDNIDKKAYYAILFEYYKNLLTDKQIDTFICYYNEDYSLAEIADEFGTSRNAVWDTLKKVVSLLENYEEKLKLYEKDQKLNDYLNKLKNHVDDEGAKIIVDIEEME